MDETVKLYTSRVRRLSQLLREYEGTLNNWMKINLEIGEDEEGEEDAEVMVTIEYYKYIVMPGYNKKPKAHRHNTLRQFPFTIVELDKAIDRIRQKISYEKKKLDENNNQS